MNGEDQVTRSKNLGTNNWRTTTAWYVTNQRLEKALDGGAHSTGFGGEPQADNKSVDASALSSRKTIRRSSH